MILKISKRVKSILISVLLACCFFAIPFFTRMALIDGRGRGFQDYDIAGVISDIGLSLIVFLLYVISSKINKIFGIVIVCVWFIFHFSNFEHVLANGDVVSLSYVKYLFNPTFLLGSGFSVSNVFLLIVMVSISLTILLIKAPSLPKRVSVLFIFVFLAGVLIRGQWGSVLNPRWRLYNVVQANMEDIFFSKYKNVDLTVKPEMRIEIKKRSKGNIDGIPFVSVDQKKHNVLIVAIEGGCAAVLPSVRDNQEIESNITMPGLDSIVQKNIVYSNFITHQRQTNRGIFSILSGSYPKLNSSTPKMTEYVTKRNMASECTQHYLSQILADQGYTTTYLQASPLPYMLKDVFMKQAGFQNSYGTKWFKYSYAKNYWGIDDKALFEHAFDLIVSNKKQKKPWFMTMLNVGTHHPLNIPDDYRVDLGETKRERAYRYLDEAICTFIEKLDMAGILKNTLVVITCDESQGVKDLKGDPASKRLSQQWGLLAVLHPKNNKGIVIDDKTSQSDLAISVIDYLGLYEHKTSFNGRSVFRKYDEKRDIYFANTYNHVMGRFTKDNKLEICDENFNHGEQYSISETGLFSKNRKYNRKLSIGEMSEIAQFGEIWNGSIINLDESLKQIFDFKSGIVHRVPEGGQKTILGGQFFTIPKNSAVTVNLRGKISGKNSVVFLKHDLSAKSGKVRIVKYMPKELVSGNHFSVTYNFYSSEEFYSSEFRVTAQLREGDTASVILEEATLAYDVRPPTTLERKMSHKRFSKKIGRDLGAFISVDDPENVLNVSGLNKNIL